MARPKKTKKDHEEDALIREVWDGVREEKAVAFIQKNWKDILYGVVVFFAVLGGIKTYQYYGHRSALKEAALFEKAQSRSAVMEKEFDVLLKTLGETGHTGYQGVAVLMQADKALKRGRRAEAIEILDKADVQEKMFENLIQLKSTLLQADQLSFEDLEEKLDDIDQDEPFYHMSQLTLGLKAMAVGDQEKAKDIFGDLVADDQTPMSIRSTAQEMKNTL